MILALFLASLVFRQPAELSPPYELEPTIAVAPTGDADLSFVANYVRIAPYIAIGGRLTDDGVARSKAAGFKTIIDLRQPDEPGVAAEEAAARELDVTYMRMSMPSGADDIRKFMPQLTAVLEQRSGYPILLHCASGNRAGAAWALYRFEAGVPAMVALEEGRAAGMLSREAIVRSIMDVQ